MISYFQELAAQFADPVKAIAQVLGLIPMVLGFFVFYFNDRRKTLAVKAACDMLFALHFFLLGQWTGGAVCVVNVFRGLAFSQRGKGKWSSNWFLPVLFCVLTVSGSLLGWTGIKSLLPMTGSVLAVIGYWCNDTKKLRRFNFMGISLWLIYAVITMSVSAIISNCVYLVSILRTEIVLKIREKAD